MSNLHNHYSNNHKTKTNNLSTQRSNLLILLAMLGGLVALIVAIGLWLMTTNSDGGLIQNNSGTTPLTNESLLAWPTVEESGNNNSLTDANEITSGLPAVVIGRITHTPGDVDSYKFHLGKAAHVSVVVKVDSSTSKSEFIMSLVHTNGNGLSSKPQRLGQHYYMTDAALAEGDYYLMVTEFGEGLTEDTLYQAYIFVDEDSGYFPDSLVPYLGLASERSGARNGSIEDSKAFMPYLYSGDAQLDSQSLPSPLVMPFDTQGLPKPIDEAQFNSLPVDESLIIKDIYPGSYEQAKGIVTPNWRTYGTVTGLELSALSDPSRLTNAEVLDRVLVVLKLKNGDYMLVRAEVYDQRIDFKIPEAEATELFVIIDRKKRSNPIAVKTVTKDRLWIYALLGSLNPF